MKQIIAESLWCIPFGVLLNMAGIKAWEKPFQFCLWVVGMSLLIKWGHSK